MIGVRFTDGGAGGSFSNQVLTMSGTGTITTTSTGNESALEGNQYALYYLGFDVGTGGAYLLRNSSNTGFITYAGIGGTPPNASTIQTVPSTMTQTVNSGVTAKEWVFDLKEQSDNLKLVSDTTTKVEFTDNESIFSNRVRFHSRTKRIYGVIRQHRETTGCYTYYIRQP